MKLHISITYWTHTIINEKGSRKSNAYLADYLGRTKQYTHKRTHDIWNIKYKTFYTNIIEDTYYGNMNTYSVYHNHKWRDIPRDLVIFFINNVAHSYSIFNQKVNTVTADSQVTTGAQMSEGTVVAKSRTYTHRHLQDWYQNGFS